MHSPTRTPRRKGHAQKIDLGNTGDIFIPAIFEQNPINFHSIQFVIHLLVIVLLVSALKSLFAGRESKATVPEIEEEPADEQSVADGQAMELVAGLGQLDVSRKGGGIPVFNYELGDETSLEHISTFLNSLPVRFEVAVPAHQLSLLDEAPRPLIFWKEDGYFIIVVAEENHVYRHLNYIRLSSLAARIYFESRAFRAQSVSVRRLVLQS